MTVLSPFLTAHLFCEFEKLYKFKVILVRLLAKRDKEVLPRAIGFEARSSLNFFQAFFSQLLKLRSNCEDLSSI